MLTAGRSRAATDMAELFRADTGVFFRFIPKPRVETQRPEESQNTENGKRGSPANRQNQLRGEER